MNTADTILGRFGLHPPSAAPGRYYTTCPKCSAARTRAHQKLECLGITIDDRGVQFGCNHCDFKGGAFYKPNGSARDPFVAVYDYYDENGKLLFQVCRRADKQFPQRRPDGNGSWVWGTKGVRKVLFHLNEVAEAIANGHAILIVEGEKDVLNLERIGLPATCNPGGASEPGKKSKWRKEYSETLRGADIIIVPDHDQAGYAHADAIASMSTGLAKSVRVLKLADHWPNCPKGGDASDWLAAGHTREQLDALIDRAEPRVDNSNKTKTTNSYNTGCLESDNPFTEDALALRFSARHVDNLRYIATKATWLKWDGSRWYEEQTHLAFDLARASCRADAQTFGNGKPPAQVYSAKVIAAVERMAKADRRQATTIEQWDADDFMLNTEEN